MPKLKLDSRSVLLAYCEDGKAKPDYYDETITGLVLEVRPRGRTYAMRYRNRYGTQRQYKIGSAQGDGGGNLLLGAHGIEGNDGAFQRQHL